MKTKKVCLFLAVILVITSLFSTMVFADNQEIRVKIDGNFITFSDQAPIIDGERVLVPMRTIFEKLGATIEWNDSTQTVTAKKGNITISLQIGSTTVVKNGQNITLDVPAKVINDRTMVPVRFVGEALGSKVEWDDSTQIVNVTSVTGTPTSTTAPVTTPVPTVAPVTTTPAASNQAAGKLTIVKATASNSQPENPVENSFDGKKDTRWASEGEQWVSYDLGDTRTVSSVAISFYAGDSRAYTFDIEVSADGKTWTKVLTKTSTGKSLDLEEFKFDKETSARYIRYKGHGSSANAWNSMFEFEVRGK